VRFRLSALAAIAVLSLAVPPACSQEIIKIGTNELPPYVSRDANESMLTAIMDEVAREMGVSFEYLFMPWERCEDALKDGEVWGIMPYVKNEARLRSYLFSDSLCEKRTVFFYYSKDPAASIVYGKLSDLKPYRIGGVRGYFYEEAFRQAGLEVEYTGSEEQNLRKLRDGRVDLTPVGDKNGWFLIRSLFPGEERYFRVVERPLDVGGIFVMVRKDAESSDRLGLFNAALGRLKKKDDYSRILNRY
jgi:ABC-type amino acid transport/signal transduction systems, periplasmic component/domain